MLLDQALDHVAAHIAVVPGAKVAVVALLEIDAQFLGDLIFHAVQGGAGLRSLRLGAFAGALRVHHP